MDQLKRASYSFALPESLIADYPLENRTDARLLVVRKAAQTIEHHHIRDLPELLPAHALLVANNTKVFRARLHGVRIGSPGKVEFFLLKKLGPAVWQGLIRSSAKVQPGFLFTVGPSEKQIRAEVLAREDTSAGTLFTVKLSRDPVDAGLGEVPLPPYIVAKRASAAAPSAKDELETYNTLFAKESGSVAAPTAGRHFTPELIAQLKSRGIDWCEITLHVGMGTFKPVTTDDIREHLMHAEFSSVSRDASQKILAAKRAGHKIIAVGTTSTRTLEGRAIRDAKGEMDLAAGEKDVNLFIHPESKHDWKLVDGILTNFHLPESTLLMMIAAFVGDLNFLKSVYETAVKEKYRFYSYGDAMLIL